MGTDALLARRQRLLGPNAPLFYDRPLHAVRGEGVWMEDASGRKYLDAYNNVPHVGHCHPHVVAALCEQAKVLNIHTRYLDEKVLEYAQRLTGTFDESLSRAMFCCTGTEANELALRIARAGTGHHGIVVSSCSYHGNSAVLAAMTTAFESGEKRGPDIRVITVPDPYYPARDLTENELLEESLRELDAAIESLRESGYGVAALLLDTVFSTEGLPQVPGRYLAEAVKRVRAAGGVFISDEVQAGLGRTGVCMWGHQVHGVVPDLVTLGKPMGNGHPLAGVITRADLADRFTSQALYFNTFAGNPVSSAVGLAVLEVIDREQLMNNARVVGEYLRKGLNDIAARYSRLGDVRGTGLFVGVEFVEDRESRRPAAHECRRVVNEMRERGVLISRIGPRDNVLKIRPPMPFSKVNADHLLSVLDDVLAGKA